MELRIYLKDGKEERCLATDLAKRNYWQKFAECKFKNKKEGFNRWDENLEQKRDEINYKDGKQEGLATVFLGTRTYHD